MRRLRKIPSIQVYDSEEMVAPGGHAVQSVSKWLKSHLYPAHDMNILRGQHPQMERHGREWQHLKTGR